MVEKKRTWDETERTADQRSQKGCAWIDENQESGRNCKERRERNDDAAMVREEKVRRRTKEVWVATKRRKGKASKAD